MGEPVKTPVLIETSRYQVTGNIAVPEGQRVSDYANDPDRAFFAVTEATIAPLDDTNRERVAGFIMVNRAEIGVMMLGHASQPKPAPVWDDDFRAALGVEPV